MNLPDTVLTLDQLIAALQEQRKTLPGTTPVLMTREDYVGTYPESDEEMWVQFDPSCISSVQPVTDSPLTYIALFHSVFDKDDLRTLLLR